MRSRGWNRYQIIATFLQKLPFRLLSTCPSHPKEISPDQALKQDKWVLTTRYYKLTQSPLFVITFFSALTFSVAKTFTVGNRLMHRNEVTPCSS